MEPKGPKVDRKEPHRVDEVSSDWIASRDDLRSFMPLPTKLLEFSDHSSYTPKVNKKTQTNKQIS